MTAGVQVVRHGSLETQGARVADIDAVDLLEEGMEIELRYRELFEIGVFESLCLIVSLDGFRDLHHLPLDLHDIPRLL